jgi:hypothetical protein
MELINSNHRPDLSEIIKTYKNLNIQNILKEFY